MGQIGKVLVIDAQGGGMGRQLVTLIKKELPEIRITAVGTNSAATSNMLKAGADVAATGENAVIVGCRRSEAIIGPIGIVMADAMNGEITPAMAMAVGQSEAVKIFIPFNSCDHIIAGTTAMTPGRLVAEAVEELKKLVQA